MAENKRQKIILTVLVSVQFLLYHEFVRSDTDLNGLLTFSITNNFFCTFSNVVF